METTSLIRDIIKTNSLHFRNVKIGDPIESVQQIEGTPAEIKEYSNPFIRYFFEIGEMEEITLYYNYAADERVVKEINLHFVHYPDHYWKKEGNQDPGEFWNLLHNNKLQPYSIVFTDTVNDAVSFFTSVLNTEPVLSFDANGVFDEPYQNFKQMTWETDGQFRISIRTYIDDSIDNNVKNTMILRLSKL